MSLKLINHSPDLSQLRSEGYDIEVKRGYLLVKSVPYLNSKKEIKYGTLVSELTLAGDITATPANHVVRFCGEAPCHKDGSPISEIINQTKTETIADGLQVDHLFSSRPPEGYKTFYDKMTTYVNILGGPARSFDSSVTARIYTTIEATEEESIFRYVDTASTRAGIVIASQKLERGKVGVIGLGGTGSYVLDFIAKTPVKEIHLFDGDTFLQHNAFRSPGAPSVDDLKQKLKKAIFFQALYSKMHRGIIAHDGYIDESNVSELREMEFIFLCLDNGAARKIIIEKLEEWGIPFIYVGMGVLEVEGALTGTLNITTSTPQKSDHIRKRISLSDDNTDNDYSRNIQVSDLNALNATLAVIKWKKMMGFYFDQEREHYTTYSIDFNLLASDDQI
jgi:hypothetical protein